MTVWAEIFRCMPCNGSASYIQRRVLFYWALRRECLSYQEGLCSKHEGKSIFKFCKARSRCLQFPAKPLIITSTVWSVRHIHVLCLQCASGVLYSSQFCFVEDWSEIFNLSTRNELEAQKLKFFVRFPPPLPLPSFPPSLSIMDSVVQLCLSLLLLFCNRAAAIFRTLPCATNI